MVSEQEGLERYLKVLNGQLDRKKGTEDFKQLQELFESKEFLIHQGLMFCKTQFYFQEWLT